MKRKYFWGATIVVFIIIFIFPVLVIEPVDLILESFLNKNYIDGWTPGVMAWNGVIVAFAFLFLFKVASVTVSFLKKQKKRKDDGAES
ncbi:MAG: hypothetical protein ABIJ59_19370 [Pseudomonadota bacterium]